jgi:DNA-binding protein HU-beta
MNKSGLIDAVAEEVKLTKINTDRVIGAIFKVITEALKKGDNVRWLGFGIFTTAKRNATTGRNPRTGKIIQIPEGFVRVKFLKMRLLRLVKPQSESHLFLILMPNYGLKACLLIFNWYRLYI